MLGGTLTVDNCCTFARAAAEHSVFVGDLAPEVGDWALQEFFRQYFPSVRSAKVRAGCLLLPLVHCCP